MLRTIRSQIEEIKVINILKQCSDKKIARVIKAPTFLFTTIWSHLAHSWHGLKYLCQAKYKTFGNR